MDFSLLKELCAIPSTAGDEGAMRDFILKYFCDHSKGFKAHPEIFSGPGFQDMVIAVFGKPRTAIFAHTDTVGFCAAHKKELVKIGNPKAKNGSTLVGKVGNETVECTLQIVKEKKQGDKKDAEPTYKYKGKKEYAPGTPLTYLPEWKETKNFVQCAYMDNRLGVWNALQQAHSMEHGALVFSTYEEHGGGGAQFAGRFLQKSYGVHQALISDVTLASTFIKQGKGVAISMRDRGIPRQAYVRRIIELAEKGGIPYQLEVEKTGGSDGNALQDSSYLWDWCFVGPPELNYHEPGEKVMKSDISAMVELYRLLMAEL